MDCSLLGPSSSPTRRSSDLDFFIDPTHRIGLMSTLRIHDHAIFVSIFDKVVIKNFTIVRTNSDRSASHSLTAFRKIIFEPAHYIHIMDMLLYDMITAEPVEVIPVPHLIFHFILAGLPFSDPYAFAIPIHLSRSNIADHSILISFQQLQIGILISSLKSDDHIEPLSLCFTCGLENSRDSCRINRDRFFHEYMFPLIRSE